MADSNKPDSYIRRAADHASFELPAPDASHPELLRLDADRDVVYRTWRLAANRLHATQQTGVKDREAKELWQILDQFDPLNVPITKISDSKAAAQSTGLLRPSTGVPVATRARFMVAGPRSTFPDPAGDSSKIVIAGQAYNKITVTATIRSLSRYNPMYFPDGSTWLPLIDLSDRMLSIVSLSHTQARLLEKRLAISESDLFEADYMTGHLDRAPDPFEERIKKAAKEHRRFIQPFTIPPLPEHRIRLYRGVAPRGLGTEFAGPLTDSEQKLFDHALERLIKMQTLSSEEQRVIDDLQYRALNANAKFFSDDEMVARHHAQDCVVYYLDLLYAEAMRYIKPNRQAQNAYSLPPEIARQANIYAVGQSTPLGIRLLPT
jgi:hypothetical protein